MCKLGWKSLGVLELTALPSIDTERWVSWVREADVLLVNGGDALYLCYWMPKNTVADAERWAAGMSVPCYAIVDDTAIKAVDSAVEVVSEGHWKRFTP